MTISTDPDTPVSLDIALKPTKESTRKRVKITNLDVKMVDEVYEERDADGNLVTPEDYLRKVREELLAACHSMVELQQAWVDKPRRDELLATLEERMVHLDILREILHRRMPTPTTCWPTLRSTPSFTVARNAPTRCSTCTRSSSRTSTRKPEVSSWPWSRSTATAGFSKWPTRPCFTLAPFNSDVRHVAKPFGGIAELRAAIDELIKRLYMAEAA
jgi:hypothetical protein